VFKHADRLKAKYVILVAPSEVEQGLVRVKALDQGEQFDVPLDELPQWFENAM